MNTTLLNGKPVRSVDGDSVVARDVLNGLGLKWPGAARIERLPGARYVTICDVRGMRMVLMVPAEAIPELVKVAESTSK